MKKFIKFTAGAILGASIASIILILLAPEPGSATRKRILQSFRDLKNQFNSAVKIQKEELEGELGDVSF